MSRFRFNAISIACCNDKRMPSALVSWAAASERRMSGAGEDASILTALLRNVPVVSDVDWHTPQVQTNPTARSSTQIFMILSHEISARQR
jgi:hypothetical protein